MTKFGAEYSKINSVFKRDMENNGVIIPDSFSQEEFDYLQDAPWRWTEKIDGTNIRVHWDGESVTVGGRTDAAQVPPGILFVLARLNHPPLWDTVFNPGERNAIGPMDVTLYGEGYGPKIQNGGAYRSDIGFILFDVRVGEWWLRPEAVAAIATAMQLDTVPFVGYMSLNEAIAAVQADSIPSAFAGVKPEGLVGTPAVALRTRRGDRIITKLKGSDFEALRKHNQRIAARQEVEDEETALRLVATEVIPADIAADAADKQVEVF